MGKKIHYLSNLDTENRTADCIKCGRVRLKKVGNHGWSCKKIWNQRQNARRFKIKNYPFGVEKPTKCEICGNNKKLVVDHNHITGLFRGFICDNCNHALGRVYDNVSILKKMIKYLK